jgi:hypothetical protein
VHRPFIEFECGKYPGSILCDYRAATKKYNKIDVLAGIIAKRAQQVATAKQDPTTNALCPPLPRRDDVVVHLRLGDVFQRGMLPGHLRKLPAERVGQRCFEERCNRYVPITRQTLDHWQRCFPNLFAGKNRTFVIVSAPFRRILNKEWAGFAEVASKAYLAVFREGLAQRGISTTLRTSCAPDTDIVYMASAQTFVPSGGGFSHLMAKLVGETPQTPPSTADSCLVQQRQLV